MVAGCYAGLHAKLALRAMCLLSNIESERFGVQGLGFRVEGLAFRV